MKSGKKCLGDACPIWQRSAYAPEPTLNIIGNVSSNTSILILQGENDSQTPVQQAFLLQQALVDKKHQESHIDNISKSWSCVLSFISSGSLGIWTNWNLMF